ncbi:MAG: anti-sigma factor family protein [Pseudomonadota bacterium]
MTDPHLTEADLQAYVDEQLPPGRRAEVEAWLAARPREAARVQAYRQQNEALRALFDPVLDEPVPAHLLPSPRRRGALFAQAAVMLLSLGVGGVSGWILHGETPAHAPLVAQTPAAMPRPVVTPAAGLARRAAVAHAVYSPDVRRPVEIGAEQEEQLVTWLSKRLGVPLRPPTLGVLGYELIGGRLLPGADGPVAQFMYHDVSGKRLTLYVSHETRDGAETAFQFAEEGPIGVFFWVEQGMGYAISAGADKGELARVAQVVHAQLRSR